MNKKHLAAAVEFPDNFLTVTTVAGGGSIMRTATSPEALAQYKQASSAPIAHSTMQHSSGA
jgi:hypothetical protein